MKDRKQSSKESSSEKTIAPDATRSGKAKEPIPQQSGKHLGTGLPGDVTQKESGRNKK